MLQDQEKRVLEANRRFYENIAPHYDSLDSRRGENRHDWIDRLLSTQAEQIRRTTGRRELSFLDAGSGSGLLVAKAKHDFARRIAVDISPAMLERIPEQGIERITADVSRIPLPDGSCDFIAAFATLHHLYDPIPFFQEAYRLLNAGGVLYTDHDIESHFVSRFRLPLRIYRSLFDHWHAYSAAVPELTKEDYDLSEFHGDEGLDAAALADKLRDIGFTGVRCEYHWEGMGRIVPPQWLCGRWWWNAPGRSPVFRLLARKPLAQGGRNES